MLKDDRFGTNYFVELEIIVNFASTVPTTPLNDAYHGGTSVFLYMRYDKQPIDFLAQIALLKERGMQFSDDCPFS